VCEGKDAVWLWEAASGPQAAKSSERLMTSLSSTSCTSAACAARRGHRPLPEDTDEGRAAAKRHAKGTLGYWAKQETGVASARRDGSPLRSGKGRRSAVRIDARFGPVQDVRREAAGKGDRRAVE
jgi:hypothetical protein